MRHGAVTRSRSQTCFIRTKTFASNVYLTAHPLELLSSPHVRRTIARQSPKSTPFLTRLPSHFPRGARLISRWLFLFRVRWRLFRLCRAERHSKIARLGFLYPHDRRETKNGSALGTALIRGRLWAAGSPTVVSTSIKPHRGPEPD